MIAVNLPNVPGLLAAINGSTALGEVADSRVPQAAGVIRLRGRDLMQLRLGH
jgi:hypothetical protein